MPEEHSLVFSCEHGGNRVPVRYRALFAGAEEVLESHRGWDIGALALAEDLAHRFGAPLFASRVTRLLVELNRSPGHPRVFSEFSRELDRDGQKRVLAAYYLPHREGLRRCVAEGVWTGRPVIHLAIHTFTPVLAGAVRRADLGLLYDPGRPGERELCRRWQRELQLLESGLLVRRNYPYRGSADGITTWLRREFADGQYLGVEVEVNQRLPMAGGPQWRALPEQITEALRRVLARVDGAPRD